ncbi:MAG: hypothetical protein H7247_15610 [Polaromonas sp.]|nr:hypothetical protein [Gemmatimonadaceae bacterium]
MKPRVPAVRLLLRVALVLGTTMVVPSYASAQQHDTMPDRTMLPRDVAVEVVTLFNAPNALRTTDVTTIDSGRTVHGDVAVLNGPVTIAGHVTGRVLAINADVLLLKGARIDGDLLVVGGEIDGADGATIRGEIRVYHPPLRYIEEDGRLVVQLADAPDDQWWRRLERRGRRNFNRLDVANAGAYNRVEGLPVRVGPVLYRDQGWGHLRFGAAAILRSASSFTSSSPDVGHDVSGEFRVGREFGVTLGARLFDIVDGVEQWQLSDLEVGLANFLFHRDYRDYYGRHGGQLHAALRATDNADLTVSYGDERWSSRSEHDPFTLFRNDLPWRVNPPVDDGRFHVAKLTLRVDTRNDAYNPLAGWYVLADFERGTGQIDHFAPTSSGGAAPATGPTRYQRGFFDLRRYNRLAPSSSLNMRLVLGGWLSGDALPLERRLSIDGPGTVPGFDFRVSGGADVGTCAAGTALPGRPAQCDRIALTQLEYRSDIRLSFTDGREGLRRTRFRADGEWVFFADAGRGWLVNSPGSALNFGRRELPPLSSYRTDIGGGLDFDQFGIYLAKALSVPTEPLNIFLRVRHRF